MNWQKIFTDSQIPLYLLAISYFVKRYFDLRSKKVEVNHSLFQQNTITAVNNFFQCYAKVELMWNQFQIWNMLSNKLTSTKIDNFVWPPLNSLKQSTLELQIYFDSNVHKLFDEIVTNFLFINGSLHKIYYYPKPDETITIRANKFEHVKTEILLKNKGLLLQISKLVRDSYK